MADRKHLMNWLKIGFRQPEFSFSEIFFYDKRDEEFFTLLSIDYFLFDENYRIPENVSTNYTENQLNTLRDRLSRIETKDPSIIFLPRLGNNSKILTDEFVSEQISIFVKLNLINLDSSTIWEV